VEEGGGGGEGVGSGTVLVLGFGIWDIVVHQTPLRGMAAKLAGLFEVVATVAALL
jgi:hypothetical protein